MHELSVCQALLDQVESIARANGATGVEQITVAVGPLSGVETRLLSNAFEFARRGSCAAAELRFETMALKVRCAECGAESGCEANALLCAACGGFRTQVISGDELMLLRVKFTASADNVIH
jgi:hydrogenase nickel incorporation protein HypA/HybF